MTQDLKIAAVAVTLFVAGIGGALIYKGRLDTTWRLATVDLSTAFSRLMSSDAPEAAFAASPSPSPAPTSFAAAPSAGLTSANSDEIASPTQQELGDARRDKTPPPSEGAGKKATITSVLPPLPGMERRRADEATAPAKEGNSSYEVASNEPVSVNGSDEDANQLIASASGRDDDADNFVPALPDMDSEEEPEQPLAPGRPALPGASLIPKPAEKVAPKPTGNADAPAPPKKPIVDSALPSPPPPIPIKGDTSAPAKPALPPIEKDKPKEPSAADKPLMPPPSLPPDLAKPPAPARRAEPPEVPSAPPKSVPKTAVEQLSGLPPAKPLPPTIEPAREPAGAKKPPLPPTMEPASVEKPRGVMPPDDPKPIEPVRKQPVIADPPQKEPGDEPKSPAAPVVIEPKTAAPSRVPVADIGAAPAKPRIVETERDTVKAIDPRTVEGATSKPTIDPTVRPEMVIEGAAPPVGEGLPNRAASTAIPARPVLAKPSVQSVNIEADMPPASPGAAPKPMIQSVDVQAELPPAAPRAAAPKPIPAPQPLATTAETPSKLSPLQAPPPPQQLAKEIQDAPMPEDAPRAAPSTPVPLVEDRGRPAVVAKAVPLTDQEAQILGSQGTWRGNPALGTPAIPAGNPAPIAVGRSSASEREQGVTTSLPRYEPVGDTTSGSPYQPVPRAGAGSYKEEFIPVATAVRSASPEGQGVRLMSGEEKSPGLTKVNVTSYDVTRYIVLDGDSFNSIAKTRYGSAEYGPALARYNDRANIAADARLVSGGRVKMPPANVLKRELARMGRAPSGDSAPTFEFASRQEPPATQASEPAATRLSMPTKSAAPPSANSGPKSGPSVGPSKLDIGAPAPTPTRSMEPASGPVAPKDEGGLVLPDLDPQPQGSATTQSNTVNKRAGFETPIAAATGRAAGGPIAAPPTAAGGGRVYTVQGKETLYAIAKRTLGDGRRWREIHAMNRDQLRSEFDLPTAGMILQLPEK